MLLSINTTTGEAERVRGCRLSDIPTRDGGLDERGLQAILFRSLGKLIPDDELLLLMQSQRWREEPDLMALDRDGKLFIFELKAWESVSENLLQVLRYGQIYGSWTYDDLDSFYRRRNGTERSLGEALRSAYGIEVPEAKVNRRQVFVVMTNGLDTGTRENVFEKELAVVR